MGVPHPSGRAAMRMLETEGFTWGDYVDIFDGGPTMSAPTDQIRTIRESRTLTVAAISDEEHGPKMMIGIGDRADFRAGYGRVRIEVDGGAVIDVESAKTLDLKVGDEILAIGR
jgi:arginine N-succinyltransferase